MCCKIFDWSDDTCVGAKLDGRGRDGIVVSDGVNTDNDLVVKVDIWVNDKPIFVEGSEIILNTFDEDTYDKDSPLTGKVNATDEVWDKPMWVKYFSK